MHELSKYILLQVRFNCLKAVELHWLVLRLVCGSLSLFSLTKCSDNSICLGRIRLGEVDALYLRVLKALSQLLHVFFSAITAITGCCSSQ